MDISNLLNFIPFMTIKNSDDDDNPGKRKYSAMWQRIIELITIVAAVWWLAGNYLSKINDAVETVKTEIVQLKLKDTARDNQMFEINRQLGILIGRADKK